MSTNQCLLHHKAEQKIIQTTRRKFFKKIKKLRELLKTAKAQNSQIQKNNKPLFLFSSVESKKYFYMLSLIPSFNSGWPA